LVPAFPLLSSKGFLASEASTRMLESSVDGGIERLQLLLSSCITKEYTLLIEGSGSMRRT